MNQMTSVREIDMGNLRPGTRLLNGQYQILEPLQKGGFAMTYMARDSLDRDVVIKECFPAGLCDRRDGQVRAVSAGLEAQFVALKQQFICEARGMAKLKHPYVVAVHQVFEENNTAYMALDYVDGIDLISVKEDDPLRLTPGFLDGTLREALMAVRHIHSKGVLHRDIAPDNLRVDKADRITLIDFGAAEARSPGSAFAVATLQAVKDGYSPPEFYLSSEEHDFSSDLYSLGATFYFLITGEVPPSGLQRRDAVRAGEADPYVPLAARHWPCGYPLILSIDRALELDRSFRPQTADQWLKLLDEAPQQRPATVAVSLSDHDLHAVLSALVKDANRTLAAETPAPARTDRQAKPKVRPEVTKAPRDKWYDIFGNPIADVASWLAEQEAKAKEISQVAVVEIEVEPEVPPVQIASPVEIDRTPPERPDASFRSFGLFGLMTRRSPRRHNAVPT